MLSLVSFHPPRSRTVCTDQPGVRNLRTKDGDLFVTSRLIRSGDELTPDFWAVMQTMSVSNHVARTAARHRPDDAEGRLRLIFRTPDWEDFVHLSFREIRFHGAENFQVARRLPAMIMNLTANLPETRLPALHRELRLLDQALEQNFNLPEDLPLARQPDLQGLG